jgi:hypothetical protein
MVNMRVLLNYCYQNNLKLIKPTFILTGNHNNNNELQSDLSKYYDLNNILVNNELFILYDSIIDYTIQKKEYYNGLLANDELFKNIIYMDIIIPYNKNIVNLANKIVEKLENNFMCIHVRRGDRITNNQINLDTQPENIQNIILKFNTTKNVYVMTNKIDEIISLKNNKNFNIFFYTDFENLFDVSDNYYLFSIENNIMDLAKIRCSTFNTPLNDYYHCYLSNEYGWQ